MSAESLPKPPNETARHAGFSHLGASLLPAARLFLDRSAPRHGAALAFYTMFSLAPLLVVITAGIALVLGTSEAQAAIYDYLLRMVGENEARSMKALADSALARARGPGLAAWIAVGTTVVGASAVFLELQAALFAIWAVEKTPTTARGLILGRLNGLGLALGIGFLLAVTMLVEAAVTAAIAWLGEGQAWLGVIGGLSDLVFVNATSAVLFSILLARLAPEKGIGWRAALPAAAVITALFAVGRYLIAAYLASTGVASAYGAAGSLAAILVWIYWSAQIFLFGACILRVQSQPEP